MSVTVYVEGGGDTDFLRSKCRKGFQCFLERAGFKGRMPKVVARGPRHCAYDAFRTAITRAAAHEHPMLFVDSEAPVAQNPASGQRVGAWQHLLARDSWPCPPGATDDHAHMMIECMESWFLADRPCLSAYFGQGFNASMLGDTSKPEAIAKAAVFSRLAAASRESKSKGMYQKGRDGFEILQRLDPAMVRKACPGAARFFAVLDMKLGA